MLYKIVLFIIILYGQSLLGKEISSELQKCMTQALLTSHHTPRSLEAKRIGQGEGALGKEFRSLMNQSEAAPYNKHIRAKTIQEAKEMSKGKDGIAQYLPGINRETLEREALLNKDGNYRHFGDAGSGGKGGTFYKYVKFDKVIGYEGGQETQWLRVEWSSGQYHGHPISMDRLNSQCGTCTKIFGANE